MAQHRDAHRRLARVVSCRKAFARCEAGRSKHRLSRCYCLFGFCTVHSARSHAFGGIGRRRAVHDCDDIHPYASDIKHRHRYAHTQRASGALLWYLSGSGHRLWSRGRTGNGRLAWWPVRRSERFEYRIGGGFRALFASGCLAVFHCIGEVDWPPRSFGIKCLHGRALPSFLRVFSGAGHGCFRPVYGELRNLFLKFRARLDEFFRRRRTYC